MPSKDNIRKRMIRYSTDFQAMNILKTNYTWDKPLPFILRPKVKGYEPTKTEWKAIACLCDEWDWGYEPDKAALRQVDEICLHGVQLNTHCDNCFCNSLGTNQRERAALPEGAEPPTCPSCGSSRKDYRKCTIYSGVHNAQSLLADGHECRKCGDKWHGNLKSSGADRAVAERVDADTIKNWLYDNYQFSINQGWHDRKTDAAVYVHDILMRWAAQVSSGTPKYELSIMLANLRWKWPGGTKEQLEEICGQDAAEVLMKRCEEAILKHSRTALELGYRAALRESAKEAPLFEAGRVAGLREAELIAVKESEEFEAANNDEGAAGCLMTSSSIMKVRVEREAVNRITP